MALKKRLLIKISGEALAGSQGFGIKADIVNQLADQVKTLYDLGAHIAIVLGGGNIFRGLELSKQGQDRVCGDHMGMLATIINAIAFKDSLESKGCETVLFSAVEMPSICESFSQRIASKAYNEGKVTLFAGGTGNPFFTTDTAAALRASEMKVDLLMKATQVDGIYSDDPNKNAKAERYTHLTHQDVLSKDLKVMDTAAFALARENNIAIAVFDVSEKDALINIAQGKGRFTLVQ